MKLVTKQAGLWHQVQNEDGSPIANIMQVLYGTTPSGQWIFEDASQPKGKKPAYTSKRHGSAKLALAAWERKFSKVG